MTKKIKTLLITLIFVFTAVFASCTTVPGVTPDDGYEDVEGVSNLEQPKNITITDLEDSFKVTFDEVENATNYSVVISSGVDVISSVKVDNGLYVFSKEKLASGMYSVKVRANGDGKRYYNSIYSDTVTFKIEGEVVEVIKNLTTPTGLNVTKEEQSLNVKFNKVDNASGYQVDLIDSANKVVLSKKLEATVTTTVIDTSAIKEGTYKLAVFAIGDGVKFNNSDYSTFVSVEVTSGTPTPGPDDGDDKLVLSDYYKSAQDLTGSALKAELRKIITNTHKRTTSYSDLKTELLKADEDPNNSNNMILFYTGQSIKKSQDLNNDWNREHVWPQSLGWFKTSGAGADMHHLRPCNISVNSSRGNKKYGTGGSYYLPLNVNGSGADYRGDCARIILYLFTRYSESDSYSFTAVFQSLDLILEWNKLDPVDHLEIQRNEYTYKIQGNKNPFIDYPEFADMIWG